VIPPELKSQLVIGGRMVIPVGAEHQQEMVVVIRAGEEDYVTEKHGAFIFVPLLRGIVN
jgi:protein-L-isoaspartate(D-aspartate) O-methyltransferase